MRAWKLAASAALICALAFVCGAIAGEVSESITNRNVGGTPLYVYDGTRWRRVTGTTTGGLAITSADAASRSSVTLLSAVSLDGPVASVSNPLAPSGANSSPFSNADLYKNKFARILVTGTAGDTVMPWSVRFYGSTDGSNYTPIMRGAQNQEVFQQLKIATRIPNDTLMVRGRGPMAAGFGMWLPLETRGGLTYSFPFILPVCSVDTTAAATNNFSFTVEITGSKQ